MSRAMERPRFYNEFVMVSWSGVPGVPQRPTDPPAPIVARIGDKDKTPQLVPNPYADKPYAPWLRAHVAGWLSGLMLENQPIMVGFDAPFGLPWVDVKAFFPGHELDPEDVGKLWLAATNQSSEEIDLTAQGFLDTFGDYYRKPTGDGPKASTRWRTVETNLPPDIKPECLFHLTTDQAVGQKAVSLMRLLRILKAICGRNLCVWPQERPKRAQPTIVEIYPPVFWRQAAVGRSEIGTIEGLNRGLRYFQCEPYKDDSSWLLEKRSTDALIGAAALRGLVRETEVWMPRKLSEPVARHEGWMFGVQ